MGFFQDVFGIGKKRDVRQTTDDELNAILVPLRDAAADLGRIIVEMEAECRRNTRSG
jgi:hypothetical protein